jgi:hypothetical protein
LFVVERCGGHHHARRAETALETLALHELLLHGVEFGAASAGSHSQALDRGDLVPFGADGRIDAAVHRSAVHVDCARPAVAAVAALLNTEVALLAQEGPQALPGARCGSGRNAVDLDGHAQAPSWCA